MSNAHRDFTLLPDDAERLANLAGPFDEHLRQIESRLGVEIANRANVFRVTGESEAARAAEAVLRSLYAETDVEDFDPHKIHLRLNAANIAQVEAVEGDAEYVPQEIAIRVKRGVVRCAISSSVCLRGPRACSCSTFSRTKNSTRRNANT